MSKEVATWKTKARNAFDERAKLYTDSKLKDFEKYFSNKQNQAAGVLSINLIATIIWRLVSNIYFRNPHVLAISEDGYGEKQAKIITRLWNTKMRLLGMKKQIRGEIQDALTCGWGVMKIGYDSEYTADPALKYLSENDYQLFQETKPAEYDRIAPGSPWWLRVHPADVALQPGRRDTDSARWGVQRYYRELEALKADGRFSNTASLKSDFHVSQTGVHAAYSSELADKQARAKEDLVLLYEIRDLYDGRISVCSANQHDKWLLDEADEITMLTGKLPWHFLVFNTIAESPYGCSMVDLLVDLQKEFNDIRTQDMHQRRVSILKVLVKRGILTTEEMENLVSENVGPVIQVDGEPTDANVRVFQPHQGMDMQVAGEAARRDIREISGLGRTQLGEEAGSRRTATEIGTIQQAFDSKTGDYRNTVAEQLLELVRDAHVIIAGTPSTPGFWTDERIIRLPNEMGIQENINFKGTDLVGDYHFTVDVESAPPLTTGQKQAERIAIYQALSQNDRINQDYLLRWAAEPFEGLDVDRLLVTEERYIKAKEMTGQAMMQKEAADRQMGMQADSAKRQDQMDEKLAVAAVQGMGAMQPPQAPKG